MRSKERLDPFYDELKWVHKKYFRDWRFGQFMSNLLGWIVSNYGRDPFFPEEDEMLKYIREYAKTSPMYKGEYEWTNRDIDE